MRGTGGADAAHLGETMPSPAVVKFQAEKNAARERATRRKVAEFEGRAAESYDRRGASILTWCPAPGWIVRIRVESDDCADPLTEQARETGIDVRRASRGDIDDTDADGDPQVYSNGFALSFDVPSDRDLLKVGRYGRDWPGCTVYHLPRGKRRPAAVALARELLETWSTLFDQGQAVYAVSMTLTAPDGEILLENSIGGIDGDSPAFYAYNDHFGGDDAVAEAIAAWSAPAAVRARAEVAERAAWAAYEAAAANLRAVSA